MPRKSRNAKSTKRARSTTTKEPLVSTSKKVGIAMYFTFLATLALVMGAQILVNDMLNPSNDMTSNPNLTNRTETSQPLQNQETDYPNEYSRNTPSLTNDTDTNSNTTRDDIDPGFYTQNDDNLIARRQDNTTTL